MMDRLKGGADNEKPKRKIRVSGAVAIDLASVRDGPSVPPDMVAATE